MAILWQHHKILRTRRGNASHQLRCLGMKTTKLLSLTITVLVALSQPTWARGAGGGGCGGGPGGGHFGGSGFSGGHFGGAGLGGFRGGGFGAAPHSFGSTRF